jgi:hypothetical protein
VSLLEIDRRAWSLAEGWRAEFLEVLLGQGKEEGLQVRYKLHTPPFEPQMDLGV